MDGRELKVRIGTRGSKLALWQARMVSERLGAMCEIVVIRTSGDILKDEPLQGRSTMGFFTREIERALVEERVDVAVHSLKDLPVEQPDGLVLAALCERHDPGDVLLVRPDAYDERAPVLPVVEGALVGAGSLRRESALGELRPDLVPTLVRGNVPTRVNKTVEGVVQALVIARAGLARLQLDPTPLLAFDLDPTVWIPAPGQATVSAEVRAGDATTSQIVRSIDHADTRRCVEIERRLLALAGGGCHTAFAAWVRSIGNGDVEAHVGTPDANGAWVRRAFRGDGDEVLRAARQWFEGGRGRGDAPVAGEETCRPARPWC